MIILLLMTENVVMLRTATHRWNVGGTNGALGDTFSLMLKMDQFEENGAMIRRADARTQCYGSEIRSWTVSAGAGFILLRKRCCQMDNAL